MGESVKENPIESVIRKWDACIRDVSKIGDSWACGAEGAFLECKTDLQAAINSYLAQPGPPKEPGDYWVKWSDIDAPIPMHVAPRSLLPDKDQIEWHCKIMPPFGEVGE